MDQRGSLEKMLEAAGGSSDEQHLEAFKTTVTQMLTPYASAVLLDPQYGLEASRRAGHAGLLLAYEASGYDTTQLGRLPDLIPEWSVRRLQEAGAAGVKLLVYYNPFDNETSNRDKHALV